MTEKPKFQPDEIDLCPACNCMTHTIDGKCGKCGKDKPKFPLCEKYGLEINQITHKGGKLMGDETWSDIKAEEVEQVLLIPETIRKGCEIEITQRDEKITRLEKEINCSGHPLTKPSTCCWEGDSVTMLGLKKMCEEAYEKIKSLEAENSKLKDELGYGQGARLASPAMLREEIAELKAELKTAKLQGKQELVELALKYIRFTRANPDDIEAWLKSQIKDVKND